MRRTFIILLLCLSVLISSCAQPAQMTADTAVATQTEPAETETVTTEEAYALVDWMIFIRYNGRSYTRDYGQPEVISENLIGEQLGTVQSKPPSPTPVDYVTNVPDDTSFGYRIGAPFYAIKDVNPAYEIAVYDAGAGEYHRLYHEDTLPRDTRIVRGALAESKGFVSPAVSVVERYEDFAGAGMAEFAAYDEAFFRDNVLAVVYLEEGSGSVSHEVSMVRRVGNTIEINIRREVPEVGTCDMAYWTVTAAISRADWDGAEIVPVIHTVEYQSDPTETPPHLFVSVDGEPYKAWRGTYSWETVNASGIGCAVHADSMHPLDAAADHPGDMPLLGVSDGGAVQLRFDVPPDSMTVRYYPDGWDSHDAADVRTWDGSTTALEVKSGLYEIIAEWSGNAENYSGEVHYAFRIE